MKYLYPILFLVALSCNKEPDVQEIVDQAIMRAGADGLQQSKVEFEFRGIEYGLERNNGQYEMVRISKDSANVIRDELTNNGFMRQVNGTQIEVLDSMATKYSNSINSVLYFALLPFRLNDEAVIKSYLGNETINGKDYYKVKITFSEEGGGDDFDDEFIYWFNINTYLIDYLAYSYHTDGGGMRFREAYNSRLINQVRVADYINYKPKQEIALEGLGKAFENGELEELSRIDLKKVRIELY